MAGIVLNTILVGDIKGHFFVPSYQRGYRWGEKEVRLLIEDIKNNGENPYCLQPIVVKKRNNAEGAEAEYELIDGQQRLTTLFLLYKFFSKRSNGFLPGPKFTLEYETRSGSEEFLNNINPDIANDNIDYWYINRAYQTMGDILPLDKAHDITKINQCLANCVSIIWYEIPQSDEDDAVSLFQRLNIGKIQLTASELVKALFLRENPDNPIKGYQDEISLQWDNIERDLHDDNLWAFLTNYGQKSYATRIDLVLDLIANKKINEKDPLYTFFEFFKLSQENSLYEVWKEIHLSFLLLKEWYANHELYHKIGYLITSESCTLSDIFNASKGKKKSEFLTIINQMIVDSIKMKDDISSLMYNKNDNLIERILLLFNIESVRTIDGGKQRFPFSMYKDEGKSWSLGHIHAQHSEGLDTNDKREKWLSDHTESLQTLMKYYDEDALKKAEIESLISEMSDLRSTIKNNPKKGGIREDFRELQERAVLFLSPDGESVHTIDNLALLDVGNNAALSNYVFDAKRKKVIEIDKSGAFIPFCTKMVFFKYYTPNDKIQIYFWGREDRESYLNAIKEKLACYLNPKND